MAIKQLLDLSNEPLITLLELERLEEENMIATARDRYNDALSKTKVLMDMEDLLKQETERFRMYHKSRTEAASSILEQ